MNEETEILFQEEIAESVEVSTDDDMQTVSGGDMYAYTISSGDIMLLNDGNDTPLQRANYLLSAILFFIVATWCIDKIKSGIRRLMKHE